MKNISDKEIKAAVRDLLKASKYLDAAGFSRESKIAIKIASDIVNNKKIQNHSGLLKQNTIASGIPHLTLRDDTPFDVTEKERIQSVIDVLETIKNNGEDLDVESEANLSEALSNLWSKLKLIINRDKNDE